MTTHYTIVFVLLCVEIFMFCTMVLPLPFMVRRKLFNFLGTSSFIGQIQNGVKIVFIFVAVLFVDAVQRLMKVNHEIQLAKQNRGTFDVRTEISMSAKRLYAQRNMYLTGFTLFLSLILSRTQSLIADLIKAQEEIVSLKKSAGGNGITQGEKQQHDTQIVTLKKQAKNQHDEYVRLSDELNAAKGQTSSKRAD
ncbi:hypothetical protein CF326_g9891 [Tilletia indica]|nr:hypothetical protein CF326_g9891 [Tilletia indica]